MGILHEQAQDIIDLLAKALQIAEGYSDQGTLTRLSSNDQYESIKKKIENDLEREWKRGISNTIEYIENYLSEAIERENDEKYIFATEIALWIDRKVSYGHSATGLLNISVLIPHTSYKYASISHLNSNHSVDETRIWICPKYPCIPAVQEVDEDDNKREVKLYNRDSFHFLNNELNNVVYYSLNFKNIRISNVIVKSEGIKIDDEKYLRIAFAPMKSSRELPLQLKEVHKGSEKRFQIESVRSPDTLKKRFNRDILLSGKENANIIFFPEMLGVEEMIDEKNTFSLNLKRLGEQLIPDGLSLPDIIIFPSIWKDCENYTIVANKDGKMLAKQEKLIPYIDRDLGIEDIRVSEVPEIVLIHITGVARVAIVICAQFLDNNTEKFMDIICQWLSANLVIVPSYSKGESDFVRMLPSFKKYGTSVVWGNCCGAIKSEKKIIGEAVIAGIDESYRFGTNSNCKDFCCSNNDACIFTIDIPYSINSKKPGKTAIPGIINHHYIREQDGGTEL